MSILHDKLTLVARDDLKNLALVGPVKMPIKQGDFEATFSWYSWQAVNKQHTKEQVVSSLNELNLAFGQQSSVLVYGDFANRDDALIRMHSICHTGDIFGAQRCDWGYQLHESMK